MNREIQKANDMLAAMQAQRDQAMNAVVMEHAESAALRRALAARDDEIGKLKAQIVALASEPAQTAAEDNSAAAKGGTAELPAAA